MRHTLVLMRHASAEGWSSEGDKARHLTPQGRQEACEAGVALRPLGISHVLCSSATRTRETVAGLGLDVPVEYMDALYECGTGTMLQRIGEVDEEVEALLVVGHAPTVPSLGAELAWASDARRADDIRCWFPTAAFTTFTFDGSWARIAEEESLHLAEVRRIGH